MSSLALERFLELAPASVLARTTLEHLFDLKWLGELFFSGLLHLMLTVRYRSGANASTDRLLQKTQNPPGKPCPNGVGFEVGWCFPG